MELCPARDAAPFRRPRLLFVLALLSSLVLGGWSDCCCDRGPRYADPCGWGPKVQPFNYDASYLFATDAGPTLGIDTGTVGYSPMMSYENKWAEFPRLRWQGKSLNVTSVIAKNSEYLYFGTNYGVMGYNIKYGSLKRYSGFPSESPGVWTLSPRLGGGVFAGLSYAWGVGIPLVYQCDTGTMADACTPVSGGPVSKAAGDRVWNIRRFGSATYAVSTAGTASSLDEVNFYNESQLPQNTPHYDIGGVDGDLVATTGMGAYRGPGRGGAWFSDNVGLGRNCFGITFAYSHFYTSCNFPKLDVYTRLSTETRWTSTGLNLPNAYGYSLQLDGGNLILGTTAGPMKYQGGTWSSYSDCLKRGYSAVSVSASSEGLAVGGYLAGYSESTDQGQTWTLNPTTYRTAAWFTARNSSGTYFTGTTGTFFRPTGASGFEPFTIPAGQPTTLGQAGDTVLVGFGSGGVGLLSGTAFTPANSGFDTSAYVNGFAANGSSVATLTDRGIFFASNAASPSWRKGANRADGQPFVGTRGIGLMNGNWLLGGSGNPTGWNIIISNPSGTLLTPAGTGIPDNAIVYALAEAPNPAPLREEDGSRSTLTASSTLFAATSSGLYVSFDGAASWSVLSRALGTAPVYALAVDGSSLWVGTSHEGLRRYSLPITFRRLLPIIVDVTTASAHYTTELEITNPGAAPAEMTLQYTASIGNGSGTVSASLDPGQQLDIADAIDWLRGKGLSIPAGGSQGGTLLLTFTNVPASSVPAVTARTTAATGPPLPVGRAGLAYVARDPDEGSEGSLTVFGLRTNAADRSNVAVYSTSANPVSVKVTAYSGAGDGASRVIADKYDLPAWGWHQFNGILDGTGFEQGWVTVERVSATGSFGLYAVINDSVTNDGSFFRAAAGRAFPSYLNVPVIVENGSFRSELVLANSDTVAAAFRLEYTESLAGSGGGFTIVNLPPMSQQLIPNAIDFLRTHGVTIGPAGGNYAGSLHVEVLGASSANVYVGARTSAPAPGGGEFGLFTPAAAPGTESELEAFVYGLRADSENRSNVAVENVGGPDDGPITLSLQVYDGDAAGAPKGAPVEVTLAPGQWHQVGNILAGAGVSNGWVKATRTSGGGPWNLYGVINDGSAPGLGTSDGSFVPKED